jgi:hypothetical protein
MKNLAKWKMDPVKEQNGVEVLWDFDDSEQPIGFTIARMGGSNKLFDRVKEEKLKPHRRALELGTPLPQDVVHNILLETFAETILKGWRGVKGEDDNDYPFNKENAVALLNEFPDIFEMLWQMSNNMEIFRQKKIAEEAKN